MRGPAYLDRFPPLVGGWSRFVDRAPSGWLLALALSLGLLVALSHSVISLLAIKPVPAPTFFPVAGLAAAVAVTVVRPGILSLFLLAIAAGGVGAFTYQGRPWTDGAIHGCALVGAALGVRTVMLAASPGDVYLRTLRGMVVFISVAAPTGAIVAAAAHGSSAVLLDGLSSVDDRFWRGILGRARADFIGILLCYPWVMWLLLGAPRESLSQRRVEGFLQILVCIAASVAAFAWIPQTNSGALIIAFAPLPLLVMSALRIGPANASFNLTAALAVLVYMTREGRGPIIKLIPEDGQTNIGLQAYIIILAIAGQTLGAVALSDRRRAKLLAQSEGRYRKFLSLSSEGVWRFELTKPIPASLPVDEQVELIFERAYLAECNDAMARMYGVPSAQDLIGVPLAAMLIKEDPRNIDFLRSVVRNDYSLVDVQSHERTVDGADVYFSNTLVGLVEQGEIILFWGTQRDITQRVAAARQIETSEARLRTLIESAPHVAYSGYTRDGVVAFWSKGAERIFGISESQAVGQPLDILQLSPGSRAIFDEAVEQSDRTGEPAGPYEWHFTSPSGEARICSGSMFAMSCPDGNRQYVCVSLDVTDRVKDEAQRRKTEEQERHAQKLESLGVMAGGIAHDFNNLLVGILGNASLAATQLAPDHPASATIRLVQQTAQRAADLTRQLLAYSGKSRISTQAINVSTLAAGIAELIPSITRLGVRPRLALSLEVPLIEGDKTQIEQVILNLTINAAEACEGTAAPAVTLFTGVSNLRPLSSERYFPDPPPPGRYLFIEVSDNGRGISPADVDRLFDPFFSTKFTGRGLGLAVVLGVVRGHRGVICVKSKLGSGTTFTVFLPIPAHHAALVAPSDSGAISPLRAISSTPESAKSAIESKPLSSRPSTSTDHSHVGAVLQRNSEVKVLVVDDEPAVREVLCRSIELVGWSTTGVGSAAEAMTVAKADPSISMVVIDITMPDGNGRDLSAELRAMYPGLTILLSSGYASESVGDLNACGADGFIAKPFTPSSLLDALLGAVASRERQQ
jgi:PAS domain S-box-containing protein